MPAVFRRETRLVVITLATPRPIGSNKSAFFHFTATQCTIYNYYKSHTPTLIFKRAIKRLTFRGCSGWCPSDLCIIYRINYRLSATNLISAAICAQSLNFQKTRFYCALFRSFIVIIENRQYFNLSFSNF